jgi:3-hydroxybutyryl-CoA dehydrogenase
LSALRAAGGLYGQKTNAGWYAYQGGKRVEPEIAPAPKVLPTSVWVRPSEGHPELVAPLVDLFKKSGIAVETSAAPSKDALIVVCPVGYDLTTAISDLKLDAARTVAVDVLFGLKGPRTLMVTPATDPRMRDAAHALLGADGQPVIVINDSPGFVAQRVVAMIVNVGCTIAQRAIASPGDIDKGAKLGLGYPFGPLEWGDQLGPKRVLHILTCLHEFYQDPRYRPSPWLKRRALLRLPLTAPEGRAR